MPRPTLLCTEASRPALYLSQRLNYRGESIWQIIAQEGRGAVRLRCIWRINGNARHKHGSVLHLRPQALAGDAWTRLPDDGPLSEYVDVKGASS